MIKLTKINECFYDSEKRKSIRCELISDTSTEISALGTNTTGIEGLKGDEHLAFGSMCFTSEGELGVLNSLGTWVFQ